MRLSITTGGRGSNQWVLTAWSRVVLDKLLLIHENTAVHEFDCRLITDLQPSKWRPRENDKGSDTNIFSWEGAAGPTGFLRKFSREIRDRTHAVKFSAEVVVAGRENFQINVLHHGSPARGPPGLLCDPRPHV